MNIYSFSEVKLNQANESFIVEISLALDQLSHNSQLKSFFSWIAKKKWFFVTGHQGAGKSTFIKESEQAFVYEWHDQNKLFSIYFTEETAFIEIAEKFITGSQAEAVWQRLTKVFKQHHIRFSGMMICLSLHQMLILAKMQRQGILNDIKRIMHAVIESREMPVWIVFTYLDIVNGFTEFFDDQLDFERQQSFGLDIQAAQNGEDLITTFNKEFQLLLDHINERLIRCLHNIRDQEKRILANDFPVQFEQIASLLRNILRHMFKQEQYIQLLRGVFFVSGKQLHTSIDSIMKPISKQVVLSTPLVSAKKRFSRGYFIHDILSNHIVTTQVNAISKRERLLRTMQIAVSALALTTTLTLAYSFKKQVDQLSQIENAIQSYKRQMQLISTRNDNELIELLSAIENINHIQSGIGSFNRTWMVLPFWGQLKQLKLTVGHAYQEVLTRQFIPRMSLQFENILNNMQQYSDAEVYSALKGYIMLMDKKRFDPVYVSLWFRMHWERYKTDILSKKQIQRYSERLYDLLKQSFQPAQLNHQLVFKVRQRLKDLSLPRVVFLKVKNLSDYSGYHLEKMDDMQIPAVFTKKGYQAIYLPQVSSVISSFDRGDWVLGHLPDVQPGQMSVMRDQIDSLYFAEYNKWWLNEVKQFKLPQIETLKEAEKVALTHSSIENKLFNRINALIINTRPFVKPSPIFESFNDGISQKFKSYHSIKASTLSKLVQGFYDLGHDLKVMNTAADPDEQAFNLVKARFNSNQGLDPLSKLFASVKQLPRNLQSPIQSYSKQVWNQLITQSQKHVSKIWQQDIVPYYKARIKDRYPLDIQAKKDIQLEDFSRFFGYSGILDTFFEEKIMPFVETDLTRWRHTVKDNAYMAFSESIIEQFERAYIIRKMFFTKKDQNPYFEFTMQPVKFSPNVSSVVIDFSGQQVYDYQGSHKVTSFKWPGAQGSNYITVLLENYKGDVDTIKYIGPWAIFRLANALHMSTTKDISTYSLNFKAKHGSSLYKVSANAKINPFISNIVDKFQLKEALFDSDERHG